MPEFTIDDVDRQIDEIRAKHRKIRPIDGRATLDKLLERARQRRLPQRKKT